MNLLALLVLSYRYWPYFLFLFFIFFLFLIERVKFVLWFCFCHFCIFFFEKVDWEALRGFLERCIIYKLRLITHTQCCSMNKTGYAKEVIRSQ